jgi:N-acetylmuramoyl-L-alanine amidase
MPLQELTPTRIIVHHSLTKDDEIVSWGAIRNYHKNVLGWLDIGYHAGVELTTRGIYEVLWGRPWDLVGAHTRGENHNALGICFVGNYDRESPPSEMLKTGAKLLRYWCRLFNIPVDRIYGHRDFTRLKSCPGEHFDLEILRGLVSLQARVEHIE